MAEAKASKSLNFCSRYPIRRRNMPTAFNQHVLENNMTRRLGHHLQASTLEGFQAKLVLPLLVELLQT